MARDVLQDLYLFIPIFSIPILHWITFYYMMISYYYFNIYTLALSAILLYYTYIYYNMFKSGEGRFTTILTLIILQFALLIYTGSIPALLFYLNTSGGMIILIGAYVLSVFYMRRAKSSTLRSILYLIPILTITPYVLAYGIFALPRFMIVLGICNTYISVLDIKTRPRVLEAYEEAVVEEVTPTPEAPREEIPTEIPGTPFEEGIEVAEEFAPTTIGYKYKPPLLGTLVSALIIMLSVLYMSSVSILTYSLYVGLIDNFYYLQYVYNGENVAWWFFIYQIQFNQVPDFRFFAILNTVLSIYVTIYVISWVKENYKKRYDEKSSLMFTLLISYLGKYSLWYFYMRAITEGKYVPLFDALLNGITYTVAALINFALRSISLIINPFYLVYHLVRLLTYSSDILVLIMLSTVLLYLAPPKKVEVIEEVPELIKPVEEVPPAEKPPVKKPPAEKVVERKRRRFAAPVMIDLKTDEEFYSLDEETKSILETLYSIDNFEGAMGYLVEKKKINLLSPSVVKFVPMDYRERFVEWYLNYCISKNRPDIGAIMLAGLDMFDLIIPFANAYILSRRLTGDFESIGDFLDWLEELLKLYKKEDLMNRVKPLALIRVK